MTQPERTPRAIIEETGRDLGDGGTLILQSAHARQPSSTPTSPSRATLEALRARARQINGDGLVEDNASTRRVSAPTR